MTQPETTEPLPHVPQFTRPNLYGIALVVAAIVTAGFWLVSHYIAHDMARDMQSWQEKLNLIADSRSDVITRQVTGQMAELRGLADNPSLQLYLTEMQQLPTGEGALPKPSAQAEYLRNLLIFTAQRGGYLALSNTNVIAANVGPEQRGGIAIIGQDGAVSVATDMPQVLKERLVERARKVPIEQEQLIDIEKADDGTIYMGYVVPIYSIQGDRTKEAIVGRIAAIRPVDEAFWSMLVHPGLTEKTLEAVLMRQEGSKIALLSPLLDKSKAMAKVIDNNRKHFVEARLLASVGSFVGDGKDYANRKVLATSRSVSGTPWFLVVKVNTDEALGASNENRNFMIALFLLAIAVVVSVIVAMWWHAVSRRSLMLSRHYRMLAAHARAQEELLRLVADCQPEAIYILDREQRYQFANLPAAQHHGMNPDALIGKTLDDVRGASRAEPIRQQAELALAQQRVMYHQHTHEAQVGKSVVRSAYVPIAHIPVAGLPEPTAGVMVIEQDITDVVREREKRLQISQDLIDTLVTLVDRRDPFAANHSLMVSGLSEHVALQMELDAVSVETVRIAASLMNIGKIVIPTNVLAKTSPLSDEERHVIRDSMLDAAELVKNIHFEGPVYETLRQWQEKWDGTGLIGLAGDHILLPARILTVTNIFVGMISPRSWRTALSTEEATKFLLDNCGTLFDRRVVVALLHFIENQEGGLWIAQMQSRREAA